MISIIIPTFNEEKYIGNCLNFLGEQFALPHEIIVTDDKSTDTTVSIAQALVAKRSSAGLLNSPLHVLVPEHKHISIAQNRNNGAKTAQGDILMFIDGDSRIQNMTKSIEGVMARFQSEPDLIALTGTLRVQPDLETWADRLIYSIFNYTHHLKNNVFHVGEASGKFQMIRRSAFEKVGGFREDLVSREDADVFQRLSKIGKTAYDPSIVVYHSGRRAHRIGWPKLLYIWATESMSVAFFDKSIAKEWKAVR